MAYDAGRHEVISVIIPCFNAIQTIDAAIKSVLDQDCGNMQVIVVDDGSTDGSGEYVVRKYPEIELIASENRGVSHARTLGFQHARGDYIQYLDADDKLAPNKINRQVKLLTCSKLDIVYGSWQKFILTTNGEKLVGEVVDRQLSDCPELDLMNDFWCPPAAYLLTRQACLKIGGWSLDLPVIQDARYFLDAAINGCTFIRDAELACYYRTGSAESLSQKNKQRFVRDCYIKSRQIELLWKQKSKLDEAHIQELVKSYFHVARNSFDSDRALFKEACADLKRLSPNFIPKNPKALHFCSKFFGYETAEQIAYWYRSTKNFLFLRGN